VQFQVLSQLRERRISSQYFKAPEEGSATEGEQSDKQPEEEVKGEKNVS